jgi:DNA repair and recombination protein RAD54 and RAD54-like protein
VISPKLLVLLLTFLGRHRSKFVEGADKENVAPKASRLYGGTPQSVDRLIKPFKCPGSATPTRTSDRPPRKRRKMNYAGADGEAEDGDRPYTNEDRLALATRDVNKYPVFRVKDKETTFKTRFSVPLVNKATGEYNAFRPAPLLGMRQGRVFVARPLHDPTAEFAIVLYDPTIDDKPATPPTTENTDQKCEEEKVIKTDEPIVHKSLAEILGLKKKVEERARVPVVIDPKLAKVLRPHQVEGVKVASKSPRARGFANDGSFCIVPRLA